MKNTYKGRSIDMKQTLIILILMALGACAQQVEPIEDYNAPVSYKYAPPDVTNLEDQTNRNVVPDCFDPLHVNHVDCRDRETKKETVSEKPKEPKEKPKDEPRCQSCEEREKRHKDWEAKGGVKGDGSNGGRKDPKGYRECKEKGFFK